MLGCGHGEPKTACFTGAQFLLQVSVGRYLQDCANRSNPFQAALGKLGDGLVKLGEDVISVGGHLGNMFVGLGNKMRGTMYVFGLHLTYVALDRPAAYCMHPMSKVNNQACFHWHAVKCMMQCACSVHPVCLCNESAL